MSGWEVVGEDEEEGEDEHEDDRGAQMLVQMRHPLSLESCRDGESCDPALPPDWLCGSGCARVQ